MHDQEKSRSLLIWSRRGGVVQKFLDHTTPLRSIYRWLRCFFLMSPPPPPAEEGSRLLQLSKRFGNLDSAWMVHSNCFLNCSNCFFKSSTSLSNLPIRSNSTSGSASAVSPETSPDSRCA